MQFKTLLSAVALLAPAWAIEFTNFPFPTNLVAGQPITLTWSGATSGPVTLTLRQGNPGNLNTVGVITSTASGGSYTWTPNPAQIAAVENTNFALEISQSGGTPNYSQQFSITGGSASALPSSLASAASSLASSVTASASSRLSSALSSASSAISAANATVTSRSSSASASASASRTSSGTAAATSAPASSGSNLKSPVALVLGAFAAIVYLS